MKLITTIPVPSIRCQLYSTPPQKRKHIERTPTYQKNKIGTKKEKEKES